MIVNNPSAYSEDNRTHIAAIACGLARVMRDAPLAARPLAQRQMAASTAWSRNCHIVAASAMSFTQISPVNRLSMVGLGGSLNPPLMPTWRPARLFEARRTDALEDLDVRGSVGIW